MANDAKPLEATVLAQVGKHIVLDRGSADGVQVRDVFDDGEKVRLTVRGKEYWVRCVTAELYVERVFDDYCLAVLTFATRAPYWDDQNKLKNGDYTVLKGYEHRVTGSASFINPNK